MGSQRHHTAAAQRILIRIQRHLNVSLPLLSSHPGARHRPVGEVHAPFALEHHHVPRSRNRSRNRCAGRPARSGRFTPHAQPAGLRIGVRRRVARLAQPRQSSSLHRPGAGASATDPRRAQAQAVPGASRCGPCRHRAVGRSRRTRRDRQWRDGLRQDDGGYCHRRRAQRRRLPPHPGALATPPGLQVAARNPGDGGRRQGLGAQWPGHAGQAAETARAVGRAGPGPGVLRPGPRADADGVPLEACLRSAAHASRRRGGLPGLRACHHRPRRRADQPGRAGSRGVPPQVQPLPCTAVVVDPSERPVRQRPVLDRVQGTEAYSNHRGSHRAEADAKVR